MTNTSTLCPQCGGKGKKVKPITLQSLLTPDAVNRISDTPYRFCDAIDCNIVYFGENGQTFTKNDLTVRVGVKEHDAPRHVCYCFDHTIEEINTEVQSTGQSTVLDDIKTRMEAACWCETKSPQGGCCLGTVGKYVKQAMAEHGHHLAADTIGEEQADCCSTTQVNVGVKNEQRQVGMLAVGGAVLSAIAASACCWLPLLLIAFGASAGGVAAWFEQYRLLFLTVAVLLLALGFYLVYRRQPACVPGSACATPRPGLRRMNQVVLWVAAILVGAFAFFPNYASWLINGAEAQPPVVTVMPGSPRLTLNIEGMTCQACAVTLRKNLASVPGVVETQVSYAEGKATLTLDAAQAPTRDRLIAVVEQTGYRVESAQTAPSAP